MYTDITGAILAGGKSSRMGVNKSFLKIGDQTIIERIVDLMKTIFSRVILITNTPEDYRFLNLPIFEDIYKRKGPLAGIHSALINSTTEKVFILSNDLPLMRREMIEYFVNYKTDKQILICRASGYLQPLVGIYTKGALPTIEKNLEHDPNKENDKRNCDSIHLLIKQVDAEIIFVEHLPFYDNEIFFNLNNRDDYKKLLTLIDKG